MVDVRFHKGSRFVEAFTSLVSTVRPASVLLATLMVCAALAGCGGASTVTPRFSRPLEGGDDRWPGESARPM